MELSESQQLTYLVEKLTTSGGKELDKANMRKLKTMCKKSNVYIECTFKLLLSQLQEDHAEVRLAAVMIVDELFQRSHAFRELILENFNEFLELTTGINFDMPLPEPKLVAKELMKYTVRCVHAWNEKYGPAYKKLVLGFNFLKGTKKVQMINADEIQTQIQRNALEARQAKKEENNRKRLEKVIADIDSNFSEITSCIAEMEACFSLLIPKFDDRFDESGTAFNKPSQTRESGFLAHDYSIELDLTEDIMDFIKVKQNEDNEVILENLHEREKMLQNVHILKVKKWLAQLGACGAPSELLKKIINLKTAITKSFEKSKELVVFQTAEEDQPSTSGISSNGKEIVNLSDDSSDDSDFEEVPDKPETSYSNHALNAKSTKVKLMETPKNTIDTNIWKPIRHDDNIEDPASYSRALAIQRTKLKHDSPSVCVNNDVIPTKVAKIHPKSAKHHPGVAPIIPFGPDLLEWDELKKQELKETLSLGKAKEYDIGHRFYGGDTAAKGDAVSDAALAALTTRSIAFTGEFEPVKWSCRAPLPSGRLCPRKDREKCPFHGKIIPRDPNGNPTDPEDKKRLSSTTKEQIEDWQDPRLLKELKAITGIDLKMPDKKSKRKKKQNKDKYENLTNIKDLKDTSRYRLERKVMDAKSVKRVSETLDKIDAKRNFQKFGNNFNYALTN